MFYYPKALYILKINFLELLQSGSFGNSLLRRYMQPCQDFANTHFKTILWLLHLRIHTAYE